MNPISRRGFLKAMGIGAGAIAGARLGGSFIGRALAATPEPTSVVVVYLDGGINAIFTGANAFTDKAFGVNGGNVTAMGNVIIDTTLADAIPQNIRNRVASIGIRHGISDHESAQRGLFMVGGASAPLKLADAIGGTGAIKAAVVGDNTLPNGQRPDPVNGISLQQITDMQATIEAIAGAKPQPNTADRAGSVKGLAAAQAMSKGAMQKHPGSLKSLDQGLTAAIKTLQKPVQPFNPTEFNDAYGLQGTGVNDFKAKMAAAELMVRAGANFVIAQDGGWDSHGDGNGDEVRNKMTQRIQPGLRTFLQRVVEGGAAERNVIVAVFGDFHRSLPGSDHQPNLSALLIGKTLKNATTGLTNDNVGLPAGGPGIDGLWQVLAAAAKVDAPPFGNNPHAAVLA
jgi:uncharacterized protein DUF1501